MASKQLFVTNRVHNVSQWPNLRQYYWSVITRDSCTGRYCWEHVLDMAILSVRLASVRPSQLGTDSRPGEIETPGLHHMIA